MVEQCPECGSRNYCMIFQLGIRTLACSGCGVTTNVTAKVASAKALQEQVKGLTANIEFYREHAALCEVPPADAEPYQPENKNG